MSATLEDIQAAIARKKATLADVQTAIQRRSEDGNADNNLDADNGGEASSGRLELLEPALTVGTGIIAEPVAGVAGIVQSLNPLADKGAGERAVQATRDALTFQPRTEAGQEALQTVGEVVKPIAESFEVAEKFLGDNVFEATDSPALSAAAATIPTAITEALGVGLAKGSVKLSQASRRASVANKINQTLSGAAPTVRQLKDASRAVFKEIDNLGISLQPKAYNGLVNKLNIQTKKNGIDPDITPKASKALARFNELTGQSPTLTDIDIMRKVAQNAASSIEPSEKALGTIMINTVDEFLDNVRPTGLKGTSGAPEIGKRYQVARELWGRARRSELLGEAFEKARLQASGFENGLRTQFRSILNNKKQRRFFKKDELTAMKRVVEGSRKENIARLIGKLGFSEGSATQLIGTSIGVGGGAVIGGAPGAIAVPLIGQVSKRLAQRMTAKNAEFADDVIRAGKDAHKITRAYLKNTVKRNRDAAELSELFMKPDIDLSDLPRIDVVREARDIAVQRRAELAAAIAAGGKPGDEE